MGCVLQAGVGQSPARQAAIFAGLPPEVGALTVNQVCGSGLRAVSLAAQAIQTGDSEIVVAGGMESMSNAPYLLPQARTGYRMGNGILVDAMIHDGLWDVYNQFHMGAAAEMVAEKYNITREDQDAFAAESHRRAAAATAEGRFRAQILPVEVPSAKKGEAPRSFDADEAIRPDTTVESTRQTQAGLQTGRHGNRRQRTRRQRWRRRGGRHQRRPGKGTGSEANGHHSRPGPGRPRAGVVFARTHRRRTQSRRQSRLVTRFR